MATRLFLVEGLPGSGKSTTAKVLYNTLKSKGINAEIYCEGDCNHPVDFDGVAYFSCEDFETLKQGNLEKKDILDNVKVPYCDGLLIPYRKVMEELCLGERLIREIVRNDIYELSLDLHMKLVLSRWSEYVKAKQDYTVIIFECCFIQNPATVTMIRDNAEKNITIEYINSLAKLVETMEPILIYVDQKDISKSFNKAKGERAKEWYESFGRYYTKQGYGLANNLDVIEVLQARKEIEEEIFNTLKLKKYKIDNSQFNVASLENNIRKIVEDNFNIR